MASEADRPSQCFSCSRDDHPSSGYQRWCEEREVWVTQRSHLRRTSESDNAVSGARPSDDTRGKVKKCVAVANGPFLPLPGGSVQIVDEVGWTAEVWNASGLLPQPVLETSDSVYTQCDLKDITARLYNENVQSKMVDVYVNSFSGLLCTIKGFSTTRSISELKSLVEQAAGISALEQHLLLEINELSDVCRLNDYVPDPQGIVNVSMVRKSPEVSQWFSSVRQDPLSFAEAPEHIRSDREIFLSACRGIRSLDHSKAALREIWNRVPDELKDDADTAMNLMATLQRPDLTSWLFANLPRKLQSVKNIAKLAVQHEGLALKHAGLELRADRDIVLAACRRVKRHLRSQKHPLMYASQELQAEAHVILEAVSWSHHAMKYAARDLRGNATFIREAMKIDLDILEFADSCLLRDNVFLCSCVCDHPQLLQKISSIVPNASQQIWEKGRCGHQLLSQGPKGPGGAPSQKEFQKLLSDFRSFC